MGNYLDLPGCIELATFLHREQKDKAGFPYIEHPLRVLQNVQDQGLPPYVQMAAVLHDTTEDTDAHFNMLCDLRVTGPAINLVIAMDRDHQELRFIQAGNPQPNKPHYDPNLSRLVGVKEYRKWKRARDIFYYQNLVKYPYGPDLKRADMKDNSLAWRTSYLTPDEQKHSKEKYEFAESVLSGETYE